VGRPAAVRAGEDQKLALTILDGYARHETTDQGIWLIRNYFAFAGRNFATNTFVIDYDADFVRQVADDLKASDPAATRRCWRWPTTATG
jgi:hypothetical protein